MKRARNATEKEEIAKQAKEHELQMQRQADETARTLLEQQKAHEEEVKKQIEAVEEAQRKAAEEAEKRHAEEMERRMAEMERQFEKKAKRMQAEMEAAQKKKADEAALQLKEAQEEAQRERDEMERERERLAAEAEGKLAALREAQQAEEKRRKEEAQKEKTVAEGALKKLQAAAKNASKEEKASLEKQMAEREKELEHLAKVQAEQESKRKRENEKQLLQAKEDAALADEVNRQAAAGAEAERKALQAKQKLVEAAKGTANKAAQQKLQAEADTANKKLQDELAKQEALAQRVAALEAQLQAQSEAKEREAEAAEQRLQREREALENQQEGLAAKERRMEELRKEQERLQAEKAAAQAEKDQKRQTMSKLLAAASSTSRDSARKKLEEDKRRQDEELEREKQRHEAEIAKMKMDMESTVKREKSKLDEQKAETAKQAELEKRAVEEDFRKKQKTQAGELDRYKREAEALRQQAEENAQKEAAMKAQAEEIERQRAKIQRLESQSFPPGAEQVVPEILNVNCDASYVTSSETVSGVYRLRRGQKPNGMPLWKRDGTDDYIFCGMNGQWFVGDEDELAEKFLTDTGNLASRQKARGRMPDAIGADETGRSGWMWYDGEEWKDGPEIYITAVSPARPPAKSAAEAKGTADPEMAAQLEQALIARQVAEKEAAAAKRREEEMRKLLADQGQMMADLGGVVGSEAGPADYGAHEDLSGEELRWRGEQARLVEGKRSRQLLIAARALQDRERLKHASQAARYQTLRTQEKGDLNDQRRLETIQKLLARYAACAAPWLQDDATRATAHLRSGLQRAQERASKAGDAQLVSEFKAGLKEIREYEEVLGGVLRKMDPKLEGGSVEGLRPQNMAPSLSRAEQRLKEDSQTLSSARQAASRRLQEAESKLDAIVSDEMAGDFAARWAQQVKTIANDNRNANRARHEFTVRVEGQMLAAIDKEVRVKKEQLAEAQADAAMRAAAEAAEREQAGREAAAAAAAASSGGQDAMSEVDKQKLVPVKLRIPGLKKGQIPDVSMFRKAFAEQVRATLDLEESQLRMRGEEKQ
eukprot:TRINITY_DN50847_c0_g2_i1.p1 TRINITY_DN50847_c0_g2~~TRINITY_DN50847_c0_g2_i1.p1  ORF type:complete len:1056 (-),score=459.90 TRINITY_DN50847_c0_g2_i1:257-3424(-)